MLHYLKANKWQATWTAAVSLLLLAMYWEVGRVFVKRWVEDPAFYHCLAVPPIVGWLLWERRAALKVAAGRPSVPGFLLLASGLLLYLAAARTGVRMGAGLAFPLIVAGIISTVYGTRLLSHVAFPIALLAFAVPLPEHVLGMIAMPMQQVSATLTAKAAPLLGLDVVQRGVNLNLHGFDIRVVEECSGMRSLIAMVLTGAVFIELFALRGLFKMVAIATIPAIVLVANVVRLVVVLLTGEYVGPKVASDMVVHGVSDVIVYAVALLAFVLIIGWLRDYQFQTGASKGKKRLVDPAGVSK